MPHDKTPQLIALIIARATTLAYPELLPELVGKFERRGFHIVLLLVEHERDADAALRQTAAMALAGIIAAVRPSDEAVRAVAARRIPLLLYNCHARRASVDSVSCDHAACGNVLANHLLQGGHRRFGIIASQDDSLVGVERVAGAVDALREGRALAIEIETGDYTYASGAAAVDAFFKRMKPRPSAIIAANDAMAIGALDRARDLRVRIPRDLSIVGIDGTETAALPSYQLTTMRQPLDRMADAAVEMLVRRVNQPDTTAEVRLFGGELVIGASARLSPPRRRGIRA